jgi:hypothetical protein
MATVINDMSIEPKANPPEESAPAAAQRSVAAGKSEPELERTIDDVHRRDHERTFRLWAH